MALSRSIHIPIDHREFPPTYAESERIRKLEQEFERIWSENGKVGTPAERSESRISKWPSKNQKQPIQPSAPTFSTINTMETRTSNLITAADVLLTIEPSETSFPHPIIHKESEKKSMPSKLELGNNEDNLFCTPEEYTLKGCCIFLLSRCFMIFAHFVMFLSFLPSMMKSCTCTDCTKRTNK